MHNVALDVLFSARPRLLDARITHAREHVLAGVREPVSRFVSWFEHWLREKGRRASKWLDLGCFATAQAMAEARAGLKE